MAPPTASVVVCTRNRAASLRETLAALAGALGADDPRREVLVVDNGSTDETPAVATAWPALSVRYLREPRPGVARARNVGLANAVGDVILFLDDDVRPPVGWLAAMCHPILSGAADAVAGGVRLAPHLRRPWMEPLHRAWLAETDWIDATAPAEMVSANMAIARRVLETVPAFDPALGPGALGQGEDALFSRQLRRAGFRIAPALDVAVEHHFDPHRLTRGAFRTTAERRGRTLAYVLHHWEHAEIPHPRRAFLLTTLRLAANRLRHPATASEGMPPWEMLAIERRALLRAWPHERRQPRHYERHGLRRR